MKSKIIALFLFLALVSCKNTENQEQKKWNKISERIQYRISEGDFELKSGKYSYKIPKTKLPYKKIVLLNASLVGYFTELGKENTIIGLSSPEYIFSEKVLKNIKNNKTTVVGDEAKYDLEKILSLKPDAVFTNYIESFQNTYDLLKKNGIEVIFIDEYLEQKPLEKSRIIELFGEVLGARNEAEKAYINIEKTYHTLSDKAQKTKHKPMVIANEMYGTQWYMPGGNTNVAQLLKDAGAQYILSENKESRAVPLSFEEVYAKSKNAEYWVNIGVYNDKKSLLSMNPNYSKLSVFNQGKLYAVTGKQKNRANDYFESGVVRADKVLADYIRIFHPEILGKDSLHYQKQLQ
ncbi:ABC transporter substrate-binding protein [Amniculibacterium sp. G2-70]|uniref:ABC transporter substrate-binding protein n=1 Tax=Amniculibacterium sp. G2-70 TaxID=2767188 RepID=UPI00165417B5|nr:ABC transporter substrate-binding protein [Amniculibacterium sp. G2-70]